MGDKETLKQWILKQKLQNYGYDYKWFNKMKNKKAQLKNQIYRMNDADIRRSLAQAGILGSGRRLSKAPETKLVITKEGKRKFVRTGKSYWDYTTGQSFNEELLNIMQISASKGKKSFWEVQDRWFK